MMRGLDNSVETVNAAASAIIQAESRVQQVTSPRRPGGCLNIHWCFGSQKQARRIGHAAHVPEAAPPPGTDQLSLQIPNLLPPSLPFTAPPSSPASFLQSGPSSAAVSPTLPGGASANIFAVGPYAHETQLVSPPVFSTFTTEPSTPTLTPPHLTTPPSPEVPFAHLLDKATQDYEFPSGSLISSAASSPFHHRVSFDLTVEEVTRCLAKESDASKDFNFGEATAGPEPQPANWAFFPMIQSGAI